MDSRVEIARAWDLFHLGSFSEAEAAVSSFPDEPEAIRLRLWVSMRRGDQVEVCRLGAWLAENGGEKFAAVGRAQQNIALATLRRPLENWLTATSRWAQAEVAYGRALVAFMEGPPDQVRAELARALPQTIEQRVRYATLRAWIYGLYEQFEKQATHLLHALSLALEGGADRSLTATIAGALALLMREIELGELAIRADTLLETVVWPLDRTMARFYAQRAIAWRKALHGGWIPAMHLLDGALSLAPDCARRGIVFADRSRVSDAVGESVAAASSRANAFDCFAEIDWSRDVIDEATGLFAAMDVLRADQQRAQELFMRADAAGVSKMSSFARGRRLKAFREFALSHLTNGDEALQHAAAAYKIFKELKYTHRATSCALRAVELGGGARWRERVERMIAEYPHSLAAKEYERLTSPVARIRGRMREVAELLVSSNKTAREIGETLGMAEGTVRVHIKHMNKILNVQNRSQLVRLFMEASSAA
ncbi:MAG: LuxR C-terminal-related transcriptional regulator [Candidatus Aquilonibacter sp.]